MNLTDSMELKYYINTKIHPNPLPYRIYLPKEKHESYNLVIYLHGAGERGKDGSKHIEKHAAILNHLIEHEVYSSSTIILAPQVSEDESWAPLLHIKKGLYKYKTNPILELTKLFNDFLEHQLFNLYPINKHRVYMIGISMGATGVIDYITRYPGKFAAVIAICGTLDVSQFLVLKKTPIWLFHSSDDQWVNCEPYRLGYKLLKNANAQVRYTEYANTGHASWEKAYQTPELLDWLFSYSK